MKLTTRTSMRLGVRSVAAGLLLALIAGLAFAKPATRNRDEIPNEYKWDLSQIYPDWDAWQADLQRLQQLMEEYAGLKGTLSEGPQAVLHAMKLGDELGMLAYKVYAYPALMRDSDTRNNEIAANLQQVMIAFARFGAATAWFNPEQLAIGEETMRGWIDSTPELQPYRFPLMDLYRQQEHVLDEEGEKLLAYATPFNQVPKSAFQELSTSDIDFAKVTLSTGEEVTASYGTYISILQNSSVQADRKAVFDAFYGAYEDNLNTYAAIYNGILQRDWFLAQARNYESTLAAALDGNDIPTGVVETLINTAREGSGVLQRYHELRKKMLKLDEYHLYDTSAPLFEFDKKYDYADVQDEIVASVKPLGKDYQETMRRAFKERWIDVYENEGKRSGAYSFGVYGVHPYMLMNYNDELDDAFTMAHELGHTMHTMLAYGTQPFATAQYTIFVAEVASTMNERLFLDYLLSRTRDPLERAALLQYQINSIIGTFYTQVLFADFELRAHRMVEEGRPITADALSQVYLEVIRDYYGDSATIDDIAGITWSRIPHFYNSPYYVYQYATCFASSAVLHDAVTTGSRKERKAATERYLDLLRSGGNDHPMNQLKKAGVDLSKRETVQAVIDQLDSLIGQLEKELAKVKS